MEGVSKKKRFMDNSVVVEGGGDARTLNGNGKNSKKFLNKNKNVCIFVYFFIV